MAKPATKTAPRAKKPAETPAPAPAAEKPAGETETAKTDGNDTTVSTAGNETVSGTAAENALTERQVPEGEDETLVIPPDHAHDHGAGLGHDEPRQPTAADAQALADHVEVRVSELVHFCRTEAAKYGADPERLAREIANQLRDAFDPDED